MAILPEAGKLCLFVTYRWDNMKNQTACKQGWHNTAVQKFKNVERNPNINYPELATNYRCMNINILFTQAMIGT